LNELENKEMEEQDLTQNGTKNTNFLLISLSQIKALVYKTVETSKRRLVFLSCQFCTPILFILLTLTFAFVLASQTKFTAPLNPIDPYATSAGPFTFDMKSGYSFGRLLFGTSGHPEFVGKLDKTSPSLSNGTFTYLKDQQSYRTFGNETAYFPYSIDHRNVFDFEEQFLNQFTYADQFLAAFHVRDKQDISIDYLIQMNNFQFSCFFNGTGFQSGFIDCLVALRSVYMNLFTKTFIGELSGGTLQINAQTQNIPLSFRPIDDFFMSLMEIPNVLRSGILVFTLTLMLPFPLIVYNVAFEKSEGTHEMMKVVC
jgi:hypothetical protein